MPGGPPRSLAEANLAMEQVLLQGGLTSRSSSLTAEHGVKQAREKLVEVDTKLRALTGKK